MDKPNIKMVRIDERLIHGQGQLWLKSLGVNLVIVANDECSTNKIQQTLMKTVVPPKVGVRFFTIDKTNEVIYKASKSQVIFVIVKSPKDALRLVEGGFPVTEINIGNIHSAEGKDKVSQFVYLGDEDKESLRKLRDEHNIKFNTKISPVSNDGESTINVLNEFL